MKSSSKSFFKKQLNRRTGTQVCVLCNKPIMGRVDWRICGKVVKLKRPFHEGCK